MALEVHEEAGGIVLTAPGVEELLRVQAERVRLHPNAERLPQRPGEGLHQVRARSSEREKVNGLHCSRLSPNFSILW